MGEYLTEKEYFVFDEISSLLMQWKADKILSSKAILLISEFSSVSLVEEFFVNVLSTLGVFRL